MKKNWFIYAYPHSYGGLHGMYDWEIVEDISKEEAELEGHALAQEVIENYHIVDENKYIMEYRQDEGIPEDREIDWDDYYDAYILPLIQEECDYEVYEVRPEVDIETIYHDNSDPKTLIHKYCII